jgi:hypothetical protein
LTATKYCPLLSEDNGIEILESLIKNDSIPSHIKQLASLTLFQYDKYIKEGDLNGLENSEDIEIC